MPPSSDDLARWVASAKGQPIFPDDKKLIDSQGRDGRRRFIEILFDRSLRDLGYSFHATLQYYCERVIQRDLEYDEAECIASFLSFTLPYVAEMCELSFIDIALAELAANEAISEFMQSSGKGTGE